MKALPTLNVISTTQDGVTAFSGYDHSPRIEDGEFFDMKNMSSRFSPVISTRPRRRLNRQLLKPNGLFAHQKLAWVDGSSFYYDGVLRGTVEDSQKQFARMGAYIVIMPDKKLFNTVTHEWTSMDNSFVETQGVRCHLCKLNGEEYEPSAIGAIEPSNPVGGDTWIDTSGDKHLMKMYNASTLAWETVPTVYTRIASSGIGVGFKEHDGIVISGLSEEGLNGSYYVVDAGDNFIIVVYMLEETINETVTVSVKRECPTMDYICECNNRLWGCNSAKHEIYASALGDATNWNSFAGVSADSYVMTAGSADKFTAACAHGGYPTFFTEKAVMQVMGTKPETFQLSVTECRGVADGSSRSIAHANENLIYNARSGVTQYASGTATGIGSALGINPPQNAVAGSVDGRFYMSAYDKDSGWWMYVYDTTKGLWMKEDSTHALFMAESDGDLFILADNGKLWAVNGSNAYAGSTDVVEDAVPWMIETGYIGCDIPRNKFISKIQVLCELSIGCAVTVEFNYLKDGEWVQVHRAKNEDQIGDILIPVIPKRCRSLKIRLSGEGDFKLFSLTWRTEKGSEHHGSSK